MYIFCFLCLPDEVKPKLSVVKNEDQKSIFVKVCQAKIPDLNAQVGIKRL